MEQHVRFDKLESTMDALAKSHKDLIGHVSKQLEKLSQQLAGPTSHEMGENSVPKNKWSGKSTMRSSPRRSSSTLSNFIPKTVKLDFSCYNGSEDPTTWLCRAEKYFVLHDIPESHKVTLASFYLEEDAQLWYQMLEQEIMYVTWEDLKQGLSSRFGPNQLEDPFSELIKPRQTGLVLDYQGEFENLLAKAGSLSQQRKFSCFITGLKESIRTDVQANSRTTLTMAIGLAKLYEANDIAQRRLTNQPARAAVTSQLGTGFQDRTPPAMPMVKRMAAEELAEWRKKGLCFHCNDKYAPGHKCPKLVMIEAWEEEDEEGDVDMELEDETEETGPEISLRAIAGLQAPKTMRIWGRS